VGRIFCPHTCVGHTPVPLNILNIIFNYLKIQYDESIEYIYMVSDISIFKVDEWAMLLNLSDVFEKAAMNIDDETDYSYALIDKTYKTCAYYLHY